MLRIKANGELLDLPPDIVLTLIYENPLVQNTRVPTPHSLTFDLPPTPKNLRICKYPNRITVGIRFQTAESELLFGPISFGVGQLKLTGFDDRIQAMFVGHTSVDNLRKKLWDVAFPDYDFGLATLTVSPDPRYGSKWYLDTNAPGNVAYNYNQMVANPVPNAKFYKGPVKVKSGQWYEYNGSSRFQLYEKSTDSNFINYYDTRLGKFNFPALAAATNGMDRPYLFPYLSYLFDTVFGELLLENPFKSPELEDLVLITTYHPAYYLFTSYLQYEDFAALMFDNYTGQDIPFHPTLNQASYLPDLPSIDLLIELMKVFCMSLYAVGSSFKLVYNSDIIGSTDKDDWDSKLIGKIRTGIKDLQYYKYGFDGHNDEPIIVKDQNVLNTIQDLINKENTESVAVDNYKISTTGEFYTKEATEAGAIYTRLNSGFGKSEESSLDPFDTSSTVTPLPMCIADYFNVKPGGFGVTMPEFKKIYVPEFDGDRMTRPVDAHIMFARGMKNSFEASRAYPFLSASNYDAFGNRMGNISLSWEGPDGLLARFHAPFKAWVEKDKLPISTEILLSPIELKNLDLSRKKHIRGKNFFIERLQVQISMNSIDPCDVDLIEA